MTGSASQAMDVVLRLSEAFQRAATGRYVCRKMVRASSSQNLINFRLECNPNLKENA